MKSKCEGFKGYRGKLGAALLFAVAFLMMTAGGWAQSLTTGALSGVVTDPSGAVIPGAKVTATSATNGSVHSTDTQGNGSYLIPLLEPGQYTITVEKTGFQTSKQAGIGVDTSTTGSLNFKLQVGASSQTVEVTGEAALIQPQNANTTTTLDTKAIENLPNPGGDITMLAQISQGAAMQVQGFGGTAGLSINGVQGNAVNYTEDGMDVNDPFNNDNNSGPSNMLLGQNAVSEVTVNTNSYSVDQGRMAAGQVNYLSKSGGNGFHGDLSYQWNGRVLNAYDFFAKSTPVSLGGPVAPKPFDNVNNWTGSIGGPIKKNKLFFFFDNEGTRIDLPNVINFKVPTPAFEAYSEAQLALGGYDTSTSLKQGSQYRYLPAETGANAANGVDELPFLKTFYSLYGNTATGTRGGTQISANTNGVTGCNILANGTVDPSFNPQLNPTAKGGINPIPKDPGCYNNGIFTGTANTPETLTSFRMDYTLNQNNTIWGKFMDDQGTQTTGVSPVNPVFDEDSFQPDREGVLDWTHVFTPTLTNDASAGFLWYGAIFDFNTPAAEHAAIDGLGEISSPFGNLGSTSFPQGRNVTQYQFIDNMTWTHGNHSLKFGENFRRELVNDHHFSEDFASTVASDYSELDYGAAGSNLERFPISPVEQFKDYSLDLYAMDTWQATRNLTFTFGLRATDNSNPIDKQPYMGDFSDFTTMSHSLASAPVTDFQPSSQLWSSVPLEVWQPRFSVAWQPRSNTLIKAGWGMFSQIPAASGAETLANNPPFYPTFDGGMNTGNLGANGSAAGCNQNSTASSSSPECGYLFAPGPFSAVAAAGAANAAFQANFKGGALSCNAPGVNPLQCVPPSNITALPAAGLTPEMVYQYSFTIQQQVGKNFSFNAGYVGTRSQHLAYTMGDNGYQTLCSGCYAPFNYSAPGTGNSGSPDPRYLSYNQTRYDGYSRYDALQAGAIERMAHGLTLNLNYTWAHCLSTGTPYMDGAGLASSLANTYANCGDDINQVLNASYTYALPFHTSGSLAKLVNGWQISGATFSEGGVPLFIAASDGNDGSSALSGHFAQQTGPFHGFVAPGVSPYSKNIANANTTPGNVQWLNPAAIISPFDAGSGQCYDYATGAEGNTPALCQFNGNNGTTLRGPGFQWTNFDLTKNVAVTERVNLRLDLQAYNLFNHPNFANPDVTGNTPGTVGEGLDAINSMASPNNGLLGQNGGDSAPRMLALQAKIVF